MKEFFAMKARLINKQLVNSDLIVFDSEEEKDRFLRSCELKEDELMLDYLQDRIEKAKDMTWWTLVDIVERNDDAEFEAIKRWVKYYLNCIEECHQFKKELENK
jgi:hypothetical protein